LELAIPLLEQEGWLRASTIPKMRADGVVDQVMRSHLIDASQRYQPPRPPKAGIIPNIDYWQLAIAHWLFSGKLPMNNEQ